MKFYNLIFLLILTISFSCSKENKTESVAEEQNNKTVIKIRRAKLDFKPAGKPIITKASNPLNFITNSNVIPVNELTAFDVLTDLYITTPGEDTLKKLSPFKVIPEVKLCKQPHPIKALPPRFKDASSYNIQYIDVDQGLLASRLKSVIVDKKGNIWIGSNGSGVCKYDGESFLNYTINNGLSNNTILTIFEDSKGNIWFTAEGYGVYRYDGKLFKQFTTEDGLTSNVTLSIFEDKKGQIWFGSWQGISIYYGQKISNAKDKEPWTN